MRRIPFRHEENDVKVHHILFIAWGIVFAFWLVRQFSEHNRRKEQRSQN